MKKVPSLNIEPSAAALSKPSWLPMLRAMVRAYQAFDLVSERNIRRLELTGPQFDIIATLGNTDGMTCKELGERTLITKGTLTGVLDRLEDKGLLKRTVARDDRRAFMIRLTDEGRACFETAFPKQIAYLDDYFGKISHDDCQQLECLLNGLRRAIERKV